VIWLPFATYRAIHHQADKASANLALEKALGARQWAAQHTSMRQLVFGIDRQHPVHMGALPTLIAAAFLPVDRYPVGGQLQLHLAVMISSAPNDRKGMCHASVTRAFS